MRRSRKIACSGPNITWVSPLSDRPRGSAQGSLATAIAAFCCVAATASVSAQHWVLSVTRPASPPAIDLDDRRVLAAGNHAALLGEITITEAPAPDTTREEDGVINLVLDDPGRRPEINLSILGPIRQGDAMYLDLNANGATDPGEGLWINPSSGEASASFSLDTAAPGSMAIHYVPNGNDPMERGEFAVSATVGYGESPHVDPDALSWTTRLQYHGVRFNVGPRIDPADPGTPHIRVRCSSGGPSCIVFLECRSHDRDEDDFFAELDAIEDKGMLLLSLDDLATMLGGSDWIKTRSCQLLSNDPVEVQVLVRTGGYLAPGVWAPDS